MGLPPVYKTKERPLADDLRCRSSFEGAERYLGPSPRTCRTIFFRSLAAELLVSQSSCALLRSTCHRLAPGVCAAGNWRPVSKKVLAAAVTTSWYWNLGRSKIPRKLGAIHLLHTTAFHSSCKFWYRVCEVVGVMGFLRICLWSDWLRHLSLGGYCVNFPWRFIIALPSFLHLALQGASFDLSDLALTSKCFGQAFSGVQVRILSMLIPDDLVYERFYLGTPLVKGRWCVPLWVGQCCGNILSWDWQVGPWLRKTDSGLMDGIRGKWKLHPNWVMTVKKFWFININGFKVGNQVWWSDCRIWNRSFITSFWHGGTMF